MVWKWKKTVTFMIQRYGISSATGIYQRTIDQLLNGLPHVIVRINDILLLGDTSAENLKTLEKILVVRFQCRAQVKPV